MGDTLNWIKVSAIYKALGGEQFITLGNFKTNAQTTLQQIQPTGYYGAGYIIDDVSVIPLDSFCLKADAGRDTTINLGDSVFIGSLTNGIDSVKWYANGTTLIDSTKPGFWVTPTTTGTSFYVLQQTVNGCFSSDTVYINAILPLNFLNYNLISSLRGTKQSIENLWSTANEINVSLFNIQRSQNSKDFTTIGTQKANNKNYNEYSFIDDLTRNEKQETWYYRVESVDFDGKKQYSETKTLNFKSQALNSISIYPNPAKDVVTIESTNAKELLIIDYLGRTVYKAAVNSQPILVNTKLLPKGLYLVQVITSQGSIKTNKLLVD